MLWFVVALVAPCLLAAAWWSSGRHGVAGPSEGRQQQVDRGSAQAKGHAALNRSHNGGMTF